MRREGKGGEGMKGKGRESMSQKGKVGMKAGGQRLWTVPVVTLTLMLNIKWYLQCVNMKVLVL